jgi:hypothetical protein
MVAGHQRTRRRILGYPHKKETRGPPIIDSFSTIREVVHQIMVVVMAEAPTHSDLHVACSTIAKPIIAPKTAPYSSSQKKNGPGIQLVFTTNNTQRSQPHHAMGSPTPAILLILPFAFLTTSLPKQSCPSSDLLSTIPLRHD